MRCWACYQRIVDVQTPALDNTQPSNAATLREIPAERRLLENIAAIVTAISTIFVSPRRFGNTLLAWSICRLLYLILSTGAKIAD